MKRGAAWILALLFAVCLVCGCNPVVKSSEHLQDYVKTLDYHDGFTVLQLTDIHWSTGSQIGDDTYGQVRYLKKVINEAVNHAGHIDLIEVTGDTFMLSNKKAVRSFIQLMEDVGIPYAMTWGNHDREGKYNPNWISKQFEKAPFSLYTEVDNDDVHERSNYVINLVQPDGSVAWQLYHLDSGASYRKTATDLFLDYDYIRPDQLEWVSNERTLVDASVPAMAYYHIAQDDFAAAHTAIESGTPGYKSKFFLNETFGESSYCSPTLDNFLKNNIKAAFLGHSHANDWVCTYPEGITYGFGVKTGTDLYYGHALAGDTSLGSPVTENFDIIGGSLVTLTDTEGNFTLEHLYLNERAGGDLVMWVEY